VGDWFSTCTLFIYAVYLAGQSYIKIRGEMLWKIERQR
jgi:hypothetical protein